MCSHTGLAESCGPHVVSTPGTLRGGSCGKTYPGTQIRLISGSNEIMLFGRNVFMGYLFDAASTAEAIDDRGWLHTLEPCFI
jgi:long-subunit acyl-CoA synthetase (AMP-forming)